MEYATRDQAQNAVSTLSNQNLMGRLVYVREVSHRGHFGILSERGFAKQYVYRIVRPNHASPEQTPVAGVTKADLLVEDSAAVPAALVVEGMVLPREVVAVKYS